MKRHVFAATALLFLVTLACRKRTPTKTYDAGTPVATVAPAPTNNEAEDNEQWRIVADLEHQCMTVVNEAIDKAWPSP